MQDRPTALELLGAVARFLDEEIVPVTEGRRQFLSRVAANVLRLVERELVCTEEHAQREWQGLDAILAVEPSPPSSDALRAALRERNASFVEHIRSGALERDPELARRVLGHVRQTVGDKLSVTNPAYLEADARRKAGKEGAASGA